MAKFTTRKIAFSAVIGALYAALTMSLAFISYGSIQFRVAEALCILPFFFPSTAWGLFIGCVIANLISAYGIVDIVFGSLATLLSVMVTAWLGTKKRDGIMIKILACLPPVVFNGIIIGAVISAATTPGAFWQGMLINGLEVAGGEFAVMMLLGLPLMIYLPRTKLFAFMERELGENGR